MSEIRVLLNGEHFEALVKGETITVLRPDGEVKIRLVDIGWKRMIDAILEAQVDKPNPEGGA